MTSVRNPPPLQKKGKKFNSTSLRALVDSYPIAYLLKYLFIYLGLFANEKGGTFIYLLIYFPPPPAFCENDHATDTFTRASRARGVARRCSI